jgi:L-lactate utilization protein LutC
MPESLPAFPQYDDPARSFRREAERVGTRVLDGDNLASAFAEILAETGATRLYWQGEAALRHPGDTVPPLSREDRGPGSLVYSEHPEGIVEFPVHLNSEPYDRDRLARVEVSVGNADWGIAETGTATESTYQAAGRVLPILAPNHVQILSRSHIVMNMAVFLSTVTLSRDESARILMTGPSRTADIEKTLILGVHGPRRLYVILVP